MLCPICQKALATELVVGIQDCICKDCARIIKIEAHLQAGNLTDQYDFERCIEELHGEFQPSRRPWRTLVRVENVDYERGYIYVIVPGWDPKQGVKLLLDDLPSEVRESIDHQKRFHAQVNIGAETNEDLYFGAWEVD